MKHTVGNYLSQSSRTFPVDAEMFAQAIQDNQNLLAIIGNIAGDKAILYGCGLDSTQTQRAAGYVFVRTVAYPQGEVLYFEGGLVQGGMHVKEVNETIVSENGDNTEEFVNAYTVRSLVAGVGTENFSWSDFIVVKNVRQLEALITTLQTQLATLQPTPVGSIIMWAGMVTSSAIPEHYMLCDGSAVSKSAYSALFAAIGGLHNTSAISGYFNLPDLRSRFIVGYNNQDTDYNTIAKKGGAKTVTLTTSQIPSHVHSVNDYYYIENSSSGSNGISGTESAGTNKFGSGRSDSDNNLLYYKTHNSAATGGSNSHENRPPYYTLAFLIRVN